MGHEPLGLDPSDKVHARLPGPPSPTSALKRWLASHIQTDWQPCSVKGPLEAVADAVETFATSFLDSSWPEPASLPSTLKLGM
eukprot:336240-Pelagomonas_calceolata.AAC.4